MQNISKKIRKLLPAKVVDLWEEEIEKARQGKAWRGWKPGARMSVVEARAWGEQAHDIMTSGEDPVTTVNQDEICTRSTVEALAVMFEQERALCIQVAKLQTRLGIHPSQTEDEDVGDGHYEYLAQHAYDAARVATKVLDGEVLGPWENLSVEQKAAWMTVAYAVTSAPLPQRQTPAVSSDAPAEAIPA